MNKQNLDYSNNEVQIDVSVTSFMIMVSTFFTGLLIASYSSFNNSIRVPVFFLIVSTLSLIFTNIIFANASGEIRAGNADGANKNAIVGNLISEYLGVYLLVISLPLTINAITSDIFLKNSVFIVSVVSLFGYSISPFSIIKRYIKIIYLRLLYSATFTAIWAISFFTQGENSVIYISSSIILFIYLTFTIVFLLLHKKS
jgi:hypothetical protein